ncbi:MAG: IPT/TIG domain-containing protein [Deltaproteobacteria bacterium]|nr:IPT/TIG domain-containing protein [Deltaproteobacteria bacterium]
MSQKTQWLSLRFLFKWFSLAIPIFTSIPSLQAQSPNCETISYPISLNHPNAGPTQSFVLTTVPRFNHLLGDLIGYRISVEALNQYTRGYENRNTTLSASPHLWNLCSVQLDVIGEAGSSHSTTGAGFPAVTEGPQIGLTPFDGSVDFAGSSGTTQTLNCRINDAIASGFTAPVYFYDDSIYTTPLDIQAHAGNTDGFWVGTVSPNSISAPIMSRTADFIFSWIYTDTTSSGPDCDGDGLADSCDILMTSSDCDANSIPDSCEIATDPTLDASTLFGGDGILDICQGRVEWEKPVSPTLGIVGAEIESYWVSGSAESPVFHTIPIDSVGGSSISDSSGYFLVPREYFSYPEQAGELGRGIRAKIGYAYDTGSVTTEYVVNYPGWDPLIPLRNPKLNRIIKFPVPVVFQAGMAGEINGGSVSVLKPFLTLDQGDSSTEASYKRSVVTSTSGFHSEQSIPAFLFFAIPSWNSGWFNMTNDGVLWGYDNDTLRTDASAVADNAIAFESYLSTRVKSALDAITEGSDSTLIPLNIAAHSYGGIISRKWLTNKHPNRYVNRYVSFDGVHGGTTAANVKYDSFFREKNINGTSQFTNTPPNPLKWNYSHFADVSPTQLFFSNDVPYGDIIHPYTSALGIGRTMSLSNYEDEPNGHCARFIGGWEIVTYTSTHSLQNVLSVAISTGRFLAYGLRPYISNLIDPSFHLADASYSTAPEDGYGVGCNVSAGTAIPFGTGTYNFEIPAAGTTDFLFPVDSQNGTLHIEALVSTNSASLNILNGSTVQPKLNTTSLPLGDGYIEAFDIALAGTVNKTLRFVTTGPASARLNVTYTNHRFLVGATDLTSYPAGSTVTVTGRLLGQTSNTIVPTSGTIEAIVTAPDGTSTQITLYDDGAHNDGTASNGVYGNFFTATSLPGFYNIHYTSNYLWVGWPILRTDDASFEIQSNAATLSSTISQGPIDDDGNGLADSWGINYSVIVNDSGEYNTSAILVGSDGSRTTLRDAFTGTASTNLNRKLTIPLSTLYKALSGITYDLESIRLSEVIEGQTLGQLTNIPVTVLAGTSVEPLPSAVISEILPSIGSYSGGYHAVLKGTGFATASQVKIGGRQATFEVLTDDSIDVKIPPSRIYGLVHGQPYPVGSPAQIDPREVAVAVTTVMGTTRLPKAFTYVK